MYCKNCGQAMNDNQAICLKCGVQRGVGTGFCYNCGQPVSADAAVCLNCGVALKNVKGSAGKGTGGNLAGQEKMTMALVSFFLGAIGIHNFMMGETKKGIVKIVANLCCGFGGILALIDFVRILTDSYEADPEKLF